MCFSPGHGNKPAVYFSMCMNECVVHTHVYLYCAFTSSFRFFCVFLLLQVYIVWESKALVLLPSQVEHLPLLQSTLDFSSDGGTVIDLPDVKELYKDSLKNLMALVIFCQDLSRFDIPDNHRQLFGMIRLADYIHVSIVYKNNV